MPLALVLNDTFKTWQRDITKLAKWNQLVDLEQLLLDRARGAFMARWFGTGLPMMAGGLRVVISNIDALVSRYRQLQREAKREQSDPNLTEPVAGIAGTMIGAMLAPTSSMVLMAVISEEMPKWTVKLAAALNWLTFGALGAALFAVGVPLLAGATPFAAIAFRDDLSVIHRALGGLARLFISARKFLEQLIGSPENVRNPLLSKLLGVLGNLAKLVPFLFALAAFVITWLGPLLSPLARQLDILITLGRQVFEIIGAAVDDFTERLRDLYAGKHSPWAILEGIIWTFQQWIKTLKEQFGNLYKTAAPAFEKIPVLEDGKTTLKMRALVEIKKALIDAFDAVLPFIKQMTSENWLIKRIKEISKRFKKIVEIFSTLDEHPHKKTGTWNSIKQKFKNYFIGKLEAEAAWPSSLSKLPDTPNIPDFPSAEEIYNREKWLSELRYKQPDIVSAFEKPGRPGEYVFTLAPDSEEIFKRLRKPPIDLLAAERRAVLGGQKREDFLQEAQAKIAEIRSMLFMVIDNLLPAAVAEQVPKLQGKLWELDEFLYGKKAEFPVRDLPDGERLSVKVLKIRIHAPGMNRNDVEAWRNDLRTALEKQVYHTEKAVPE